MQDPRPVVCTIPLLGPFHLRMPQYNAVSVAQAVAAFRPGAVALASLPDGALARPGWQDEADLPLPQAVEPWARRHGVALVALGDPPEDPAAEDDLRRYLSQYPEGRERVRRADEGLATVRDLLLQPLSAARVHDELVPAVAAHQAARAEAFGEGPGTLWLAERMERVADRIAALEAERVAVLVGIDDVAALRGALERRRGRVRLEPAPRPSPDDAARTRAFLDYAMRGEIEDVAATLQHLREIDRPEARYHEANLLLAHGEVEAALATLEEASAGDFSEPFFLPGFLLCRLGQLYDLAGRRDAARRSYRGVLALGYAPAEARTAAHAGLAQPFTLQDPAQDDEDAAR